MKRPTVSVVIPVYNNEPYIAAAVESVLAQTLSPTEIIVVDDGSTDGTAEALKVYLDRIRYIYQQNRGEPAARNRGIRESVGEYIAFLDGDDLWRPEKLELQMKYLQEHPNCALIYADMSTFDENGIIDASVKARFRMSLPSGQIFRALFMRSLFGSGSVVLRRNCVEQVGYFDEDLLIGSDYEMWLRVARKYELGAVDQPLLLYRCHPNMATRGLGLKMCNGVPWEVAVLSKILRRYPEARNEVGTSVVSRRLSKPYAGLARANLRRSANKAARPLMRKAIAHWPSNVWYWMLYGATFLGPAQISAARSIYRRLLYREVAQNTDTTTA